MSLVVVVVARRCVGVGVGCLLLLMLSFALFVVWLLVVGCRLFVVSRLFLVCVSSDGDVDCWILFVKVASRCCCLLL